MKPRVRSLVWTDVKTGKRERRWHVSFTDGCGCVEESDFPTFSLALRFAAHIALGGSRWEFAG